MKITKVSKISSTQTPSKSRVQTQKRKEVTTTQILLIIVAILLVIFIQNQEAILRNIAQQRATLFADESSSPQTSNEESDSQNNKNIFDIYYKQQQTYLNEEQASQQSKSNRQTGDIRPLFKQLLEDRLERVLNKKREQIIITNTPTKNWTKVNLNDISLSSIKDIIIKQKSKSILNGSQFYHGQMSFIVSLKASANFLQNSLFLEHTMIEQMGKGKQISKIIDNTFQYALKSTIGFEGISKFVNTQRGIHKQIHGIAALKSASKTIRTQFTVDLIYTLVETGIDFTRVVKGTITGKTFVKNIFVNLVSTTGSTVGYTYGTIKFGNQLGGIMGSITGAFSSNFIAQVIYNGLFSDEPQVTEEEIVKIFKEVIYTETANTDLNMNEMELLISKVQSSSIFKIDSSYEEIAFRQNLIELVKSFVAQIFENRDKVVSV